MEISSISSITGAIQGTSRKKICQELGLESLRARKWYKRLSCMFKILKERTRINRMPTFHCRTDCFKKSFFPFYSKGLVQIR